MEHALAFACAETGAVGGDKVIALDIPVKSGIVFDFFIIDTAAELHQIIVDPAAHFLCGRQSDQFQRRHRHCVFQLA